ncbi:MAG: hypothetical protein QOE94_1259 [Mycobacterium sp.]|nr:hypothetical protein [Mycobacterium sp.]
MRDPVIGRSLTIRPDLDLGLDPDPALEDLVGLADLMGLVGRADLRLAVLRPAVLRRVVPLLAVLADLTDLVGLRLVVLRRVDLRLVVLRLVGLRRVGLRLVDLDPMALVGLGDRLGPVVPVGLDLADLDLVVDLVVPELTSRVDPAAPDLTGRVDLAGPVALVDLVAPVVPVVPDLTARVDLAGPVDHRRRHTRPGVPTIAVAPNLVAPLTLRTASAHPTMARRLRLRSAASAGMTGLLPEGLRPTGPGRRLRVAGTVRRLRVGGTLDGMGRRAT